jgi:hypothetical protein
MIYAPLLSIRAQVTRFAIPYSLPPCCNVSVITQTANRGRNPIQFGAGLLPTSQSRVAPGGVGGQYIVQEREALRLQVIRQRNGIETKDEGFTAESDP